MAGGVAEIEIAGETSAEAVLERMEGARALPETRVVLLDAREGATAVVASEATLRVLARFGLPVVFAFDSLLTGAMAEIALAADIRVCGAAGALQGRLTGNARVRSLTDEGTALVLFLGQTPVDAGTLLAAGLVSNVVDSGKAAEEGRRLAEIIASRGPIATRLGKEAIWRGLGQPLEQALRYETDLTLLLQTTKDRGEGVRAFLEKRTPIFTGE